MKKRIILAGAILAGLLLAGCGSGAKGNAEPEGGAQEMQTEKEDIVQNEGINEIAQRIQGDYDMCAIIREIGDGKVVLDTVEFITLADTERVAELELTEADFPNGYYIYNADENTDEYTLSEDAEFHFIDWGRNFVPEDAEDIRFSTADRAVFEEYIKPHLEAGSKTPFFFNFDGEKVSRITEETLTSM